VPAGRSGGSLRNPGDDVRSDSSAVSLGEVCQTRPLCAWGIRHGQPHAEARALPDDTLHRNASPKDLQQPPNDMET
jgi:hypothetical protein